MVSRSFPWRELQAEDTVCGGVLYPQKSNELGVAHENCAAVERLQRSGQDKGYLQICVFVLPLHFAYVRECGLSLLRGERVEFKLSSIPRPIKYNTAKLPTHPLELAQQKRCQFGVLTEVLHKIAVGSLVFRRDWVSPLDELFNRGGDVFGVIDTRVVR